VIKPLGRLFSHIKGISGSTILGSGEVALILDASSLVQQMSEKDSLPNNQTAGAVAHSSH
jgi:two-component system chemotaxis sensor kinase CheA